MKLIDYIEDEIPDYAFSYFVNGDASGIEDEDRAAADEWYAACADKLLRKYPEAEIDLWTEDGEGGFVGYPAFGLACNCISGAVVALVDDDDPRPEISPPDFMEDEDEDEI